MQYLVEEIISVGYHIARGLYDNPIDAQRKAQEMFVLEGILEENIKIKEIPLKEENYGN
ncbi:hypothetical protein [uncultured Methanobrevibacter sp.]|uniref:hypothetical protein n=1 Tax=uncultured Methanobrevibacter sp. TaxID=253161 RepID=UPI002639DB96|nr:hypothetical protein [uncultured Methanobrevibacter sp.]